MHSQVETSGQPAVGGGGSSEPPPKLAPHLIQVPGADWALWRWTALRATGFPFEMLLSLGRPECAAAAEQVLAAEEDLKWAKDQLLSTLRSDSGRATKEERKVLRKARRRIVKNSRVENSEGINAATMADLEDYHDALDELEDAQAEFDEAFEAAEVESCDAILKVARDDLFQEAVVWQNRRAFHTALKRLLEASNPVKLRNAQWLVARYLQRYCAKNDTIGFFGPVGWAHWTDGEAVTVTPQPQMIFDREAGFEVWGLDQLAKVIEPEVIDWLPPHRLPFLRLIDNALTMPLQDPIPLNDAEVVMFKACDATRSARELFAELPAESEAVRDAAHARELLEKLRDDGWVAWGLEVPLGPHPQRWLRKRLQLVGDDEIREAALTRVEDLNAARLAVQNAAGDAKAVDDAMNHLEEEFSRLTGSKPTRAAGRTYAARTLLYEDTQRNAEVTLGPDFLEVLAPTLELLLIGARWLAYRTADEFRRSFREIYAQLVEQSGSSTVEFVDFWFQAHHLLFGARERPVDRAIADYQSRWAELLAIDTDVRQVQRSTAKLKARALAAFETPESGWPSAYHHSPDMMIAADGVEAIREGRYQIVMGEFHAALNTLNTSLFVEHHPRSAELHESFDKDVRVPRLVVGTAKDVPRATARTVLVMHGSQDYSLATSARADIARGPNPLEVTDLVVERVDDELIVRARDSRVSFEVVDGFSSIISLMLTLKHSLLPSSNYKPRITVDRVVINRESWRLAATDPDFPWVKDDSERFMAARRWARKHGMPRFVFVKISTEVKPTYVDFDSPIYVDILSKDIRRAATKAPDEATVSISEMLPAPDQLWMHDAQNRTYTSELRMVAVDLAT